MSIARTFWETLEARDWEAFGAVVIDDVVAWWPQSRERVRGREALVRFMAEFPGDWHLRVERDHVDSTGAATLIAFTSGGETVSGATFFELASDGRISGFTEFWPEPYEPPAGREHLVDRVPA